MSDHMILDNVEIISIRMEAAYGHIRKVRLINKEHSIVWGTSCIHWNKLEWVNPRSLTKWNKPFSVSSIFLLK